MANTKKTQPTTVTTFVATLPPCDWCGQPAHYDFLTKAGPWACGCEAHYKANRMHATLGTGKGQKMVARAASPAVEASNSAPEPRLDQAVQLVDTREAWLRRAVPRLTALIKERAELQVPAELQVSVGFARGSKKAIGLCIDSQGSVDEKTKNILICPTIGEPARALDVLLHEMLHAALGAKVGHGKPFAQAARACGLEGKPTATTAGKELQAQLEQMAKEHLGPYPHVAVKARPAIKKPKPGKSEWVRMYSPTLEGYRINVLREQVAEYGAPMDPEGDEMVFENPFA